MQGGHENHQTTLKRSGYEGVCIEYNCYKCIVKFYEHHFYCAVACLNERAGLQCTDCSHVYKNSFGLLMRLRDRMWEAYFLGALQDYALDMLAANFTTCAREGIGCLSMLTICPQ